MVSRLNLTQRQNGNTEMAFSNPFLSSVGTVLLFPEFNQLYQQQQINDKLCFCYVIVLSEMRVKEYLSANPQVLEDFIMADISQEQLERWLIRKTQALEPITGDSNNGTHASIST